MTDKTKIIDYLSTSKFFKNIPDLESHVTAWLDAYPINILKELKGLNAYLLSNPGKRPRNIAAFINRNLNHAAGPPDKRCPSMDEVMKKLTASMSQPQKGQQGRPEKIDYAARQRELALQAKRLGVTP